MKHLPPVSPSHSVLLLAGRPPVLSRSRWSKCTCSYCGPFIMELSQTWVEVDTVGGWAPDACPAASALTCSCPVPLHPQALWSSSQTASSVDSLVNISVSKYPVTVQIFSFQIRNKVRPIYCPWSGYLKFHYIDFHVFVFLLQLRFEDNASFLPKFPAALYCWLHSDDIWMCSFVLHISWRWHLSSGGYFPVWWPLGTWLLIDEIWLVWIERCRNCHRHMGLRRAWRQHPVRMRVEM